MLKHLHKLYSIVTVGYVSIPIFEPKSTLLKVNVIIRRPIWTAFPARLTSRKSSTLHIAIENTAAVFLQLAAAFGMLLN